jgi:hypothetical protein
MYLSLILSLLLLPLMETLIIETNLLITLLALTLFIVFLVLISLLIRSLIEMTTITKNNYYFNNNSLLMRNFQILLINSLTHFLNLINKLINNYYECNQTNDCFERNESKFCGKYLDIRNESKTFAKLITDNYIHFWYNSINGGNYDFINDCENILQKIFINLFQKCEQKLNSKVVFEKSLILLEKHLIDRKFDSIINSNYLVNENERVAQIVERVLRLSAPEELSSVIDIRNDRNIEIRNSSHCFSLFIMIREMLTQSVFIPITDIITDPKFIYSNIIWFCEQTNANNKYNSSIDKQIDKNRSEIQNQSSNSNELTFKESEEKIETQETNTSITSQTNCLRYTNKSISNPSLDSLPTIGLINADSVQQLFRPKSDNNLDLSANHEQKGIKVRKRFI